jgi:hypothetical protein
MSEQQIYSDTQAEQINSLLERFNALFKPVLEPVVSSVRTSLTGSLFPGGVAEILKQEPLITIAVYDAKI